MKVRRNYFFLILLFVAMYFDVRLAMALSSRLIQSIPLPQVEGRIDHLAIDLQGQRLFVAALGNNTVEVVDLRKGERVQTLKGFHEPQGVLFIPELNKLLVTNGGDGSIKVLNGSSFEILKELKPLPDADNIRYNSLGKFIYAGYGDGGMAIIDAEHITSQGSIPLKGHPEAFELEKSGARIFVNIPSAGQIAVINRMKRSVVSTWTTTTAQANFPMALDEPHHRLFVGFRRPAKMVVLDTESGKEVANLPINRDPDDIFYDPLHQNIYIACGEGFLDLVKQKDADRYEMIERIPTASGARTALFVPREGRLYLAVPHRGNQRAEIRIYDFQT